MSASSQWQFVGNVPENYERYLVPSIFAPWALDLVELAALRPRERVLDIACGTGIVARTAARRLNDAASVVGLDLSAPMLEVARSAAKVEGLAAEWREGNAAELPLADATFDVAFCQQGLQFFPDRPTALSEIYRILVPSGRLVLSVWRGIERSPGFAVLADALTHHIGPEAGALMTSGPFVLSNSEALRTLITEAGFSDITVRSALKTLRFPSPDEFAVRYVSGSALASFVSGADDDTRSAFLAEVKEKLQRYVDEQGLAFPIESNVAIAHK